MNTRQRSLLLKEDESSVSKRPGPSSSETLHSQSIYPKRPKRYDFRPYYGGDNESMELPEPHEAKNDMEQNNPTFFPVPLQVEQSKTKDLDTPESLRQVEMEYEAELVQEEEDEPMGGFGANVSDSSSESSTESSDVEPETTEASPEMPEIDGRNLYESLDDLLDDLPPRERALLKIRYIIDQASISSTSIFSSRMVVIVIINYFFLLTLVYSLYRSYNITAHTGR